MSILLANTETEPWIWILAILGGMIYLFKQSAKTKGIEEDNAQRFTGTVLFAPGEWSPQSELMTRLPRKTALREKYEAGIGALAASKASHRETLLQYGVPVEALIVDLYEKRTLNKRGVASQEEMDLEFHLNGKKISCSGVLFPRGLAIKGQVITLLVDSNDPKKVCAYPDEYFVIH
jgi:hypothetical protein